MKETIPKWYKRAERFEFKKSIISKILEEYTKPTEYTYNKKKLKYVPEQKEVLAYEKELNKLSIKQLLEISTINKSKKVNKKKYTFSDSLNNLKRKKAMIIRIYHKNGNYSDRITSRHTRVLTVDNLKYLMPPNMATYDISQRMFCYSYFENNPFPVMFNDDRPKTFPDAELLEKTLHFEFAQKMAQMTELRKKIDLTFVFSILAFASAVGSCIIGLVIAHKLGVF